MIYALLSKIVASRIYAILWAKSLRMPGLGGGGGGQPNSGNAWILGASGPGTPPLFAHDQLDLYQMDRRRLDLVKVKLVPVAHLTLVTILGYVQQVDNESKTQQITFICKTNCTQLQIIMIKDLISELSVFGIHFIFYILHWLNS